MSRQYFYAASSNWCHDPIFMKQKHVCLDFVTTMFLALLTFLSLSGKFVVTGLLCIQLIFVLRPSLLCRDKSSIPCVGIFVTT